MRRRTIAKLLLAATLATTMLAGLPADAAQKRGCQAQDLQADDRCQYIATSRTGRLTTVARQWIVNIYNNLGNLADVIYCNNICIRTITFRTFPGGRVHLWLYRGYAKIGDK